MQVAETLDDLLFNPGATVMDGTSNSTFYFGSAPNQALLAGVEWVQFNLGKLFFIVSGPASNTDDQQVKVLLRADIDVFGGKVAGDWSWDDSVGAGSLVAAIRAAMPGRGESTAQLRCGHDRNGRSSKGKRNWYRERYVTGKIALGKIG